MGDDGLVERRYYITPSPHSSIAVLRLFSAICLALATFSAQAEVKLLTSIKPLQLIAAAVQQGVGNPDVLLPPGASPHNYALRPSDVRRVREADLLYWVGADMESFLPRVLGGRELPSVAVQDLPGMSLRHFGESTGHTDTDHDHDHDHDAASASEPADEHDHDHIPGTLDAHLWLLPANARVIAQRMAADLSQLDPVNAARYQANAQSFEQRLTALDQRLNQQVQGVRGKPYFVFHETYDYFEAAYGLKHTGVFSVLGEVQPGAQHVAAMRERLQAVGPTCVFSEPPLRPRLAETLTAGLPVKLAELDAMGTGITVNEQGYEAMLTQLASELVGCLNSL